MRSPIRPRLATLFLALALLVPAIAWSQEEPPPQAAPPAEELAPERTPPPGFEPIRGKEETVESVSASTMVVLAYAAFYVLMFGYVVLIVRDQSRLGREMRELEAKLERRSRS